jgi:hypothetical protein
MRDWPEPPLEELLWTAAAARLVFGPDMAGLSTHTHSAPLMCVFAP